MREATAADVPQLAALEALCNPSPWSVAQLQAALHAPCRIWLTDDGNRRAAAMLVWQEIVGEAEILLLDTHPDCRRRGLASALLHALTAHAEARQWQRLLLEVRAGNAAATALYLAHGFTPCGRRRGYYGGTEDAVLMEKTLC